MSAQFGRWNFDGVPIEESYLEKVSALLAPYGPDGAHSYSSRSVHLRYHAFDTTAESREESQPYVSGSGRVVSWDGRLDNREELLARFDQHPACARADVALVARAYERWGRESFSRFVGDWAVVIWSPGNRLLTLAKDFVGTRPLYYALENDRVTWSTVLDPLVLLAGKSFRLEEEYLAGHLLSFPQSHLTPYAGILSVPPCCVVEISPRKRTIHRYWEFNARETIRYRSDSEYEEHFRRVFRESVRRRLRSETPVLAELSGGMDSSSIVCMADQIIEQGAASTPRLDTVSYHDDGDPHWNERPYFSRVESKRGRSGCHIEVSPADIFPFFPLDGAFRSTPGARPSHNPAARKFAACLLDQGHRVLLSGIGGDEVSGGVPTPVPELADLLARAKFLSLARRLAVWALRRRQPWPLLAWEALREFLPSALVGRAKHYRWPPWLCPEFTARNRRALAALDTRYSFFGPLPSFQENLDTLDGLRRQMAALPLPSQPTYEIRRPFLDRHLLEFIYAIPREQLVRPGERRSLLRRALQGIVPDEVLNRKRKAYLSRGPLAGLSASFPQAIQMNGRMIAEALGILDTQDYLSEVRAACHGQQSAVLAIMRTLGLEYWLQGLQERKLVEIPNGWPKSGVPRRSRPGKGRCASPTVPLAR